MPDEKATDSQARCALLSRWMDHFTFHFNCSEAAILFDSARKAEETSYKPFFIFAGIADTVRLKRAMFELWRDEFERRKVVPQWQKQLAEKGPPRFW